MVFIVLLLFNIINTFEFVVYLIDCADCFCFTGFCVVGFLVLVCLC